jgi:hypothetical protein
MQNEQKPADQKPVKNKGGRPLGFSPKAKANSIRIEIQGDEVVIRLPKKDLSRKLLADLI